MERSKSLELKLTEVELETLINAVRRRPMVVSLNLNLSCAPPGEEDFLNLTTARPFLTLVERFAGFEETFLRLNSRRPEQ